MRINYYRHQSRHLNKFIFLFSYTFLLSYAILTIFTSFCPKIIYSFQFPVNIQYQRKFFCTNNRTNFKVDDNLIADIKERFNNSLEQANSFILNELSYLKTNVDDESISVIQSVMQSLLATLNCENLDFQRNPIQQEKRETIRKVIKSAHKKYKVANYAQEVFWAKHGLSIANNKILKYIKTRDILDIGAYCGDSLLIFLEYTNKTVYSYEFSPSNLHLVDLVIDDNRLKKKRFKIMYKAIGNETKNMETYFEMSPFAHLIEKVGGLPIEITTVDADSKKLNMSVGFIKINIVGSELLALEGAVETIKRDRPVISCSMSYNFDGLFRIRHFIDKFDDYLVKYRFGSWYSGSFGELYIFAYPKELEID